MKKFLSLFLAIIMTALLFSACNVEDGTGNDTTTDTVTNTSTETGTDTNSDTSTDTSDGVTEDSTLPNTTITTTESNYYKTIYLGKYLGEDAGISAKSYYPNAYAKYLTSYEEAVKAVSNFSLLDEALFEENVILVIEKTGTFYYDEIGYRNLDNLKTSSSAITLDVVNAGANESIETEYDYVLVPRTKNHMSEDAGVFKPIHIIENYKDGYTYITEEIDAPTFDPKKENAWYFEDALEAMKFVYSQSTDVAEAVPDLDYDSSSAVVFYHTKELRRYYGVRTNLGFLGFSDISSNESNIYLNADYYYHKSGTELQEGSWLTCLIIPKELISSEICENPKIHVFLNKYNGSTFFSSEEINEEDILEETFEFGYVYNHKTDKETNEYLATLLCGNSYLMDGFEHVYIPKDIIAGDKMFIKYVGELYTELSEPGITYIHNGKVVSYGFYFAEVLYVSENENLINKIKSEYEILSDYVILDTNGRYTTLDNYSGSEIYLVFSEIKSSVEVLSTKENKKQVVCMYAYNPRTKAPTNQGAYEADFLYYEKQVDYQTQTITSRLFFESSLLDGEFEKIVFPEDIIAGDMLHFEYSGEIWSAQTSPADTALIGELKSYHFTYAEVVKIAKADFDMDELNSQYLLPEYVVLNKEGKCTTLEKFVESSSFKALYLTIKQTTNTDFIKGKTPVVAIYAYNPRTNAAPNESVFEAGYIYNHVFDSETNEPYATLLFDCRYLHIEGIEYPNDLVAGDKIYIEYDGVLMTEELYPGSTYLFGELISYRFEQAEVICLEEYYLDTLVELSESGTALPANGKIILDEHGRFMSLEEYIKEFPNTEIYISVTKTPSFKHWGDEIHIKGIYAYNPR